MHNYLCILGRQPELGLAELESLLGSDHVIAVGKGAARIDTSLPDFFFDRLGGSIKLCQIESVITTTDWPHLQRTLITSALSFLPLEGSGKFHIGLSGYELHASAKQLLAVGLNLKKAVRKAADRPVRLVSTGEQLALNSAQVLHNHLLDTNGRELVLYGDADGTTILGTTIAEQDITSYTIRDRGRPKRDARVGMLPPKLAQILINLAVGAAPPELTTTILDPFCGTGVVLQEARLMGYSVQGSDLEPRMATYSQQNMQWLQDTIMANATSQTLPAITIGDATTYIWQPKPQYVVSETYLGRPFTVTPSREILAQTTSECNLIVKKFLRNLRTQLTENSRICIAIPTWQTSPQQFMHLPLVDQMSEIGYNRISFEHVSTSDLVYYRPDQIVAREILVLTRI
jgi:tRNA G10  N-methylase Trm11